MTAPALDQRETAFAASVAIPFGYRQIQGRATKGDGIWDGTKFRKVRRDYPSTEAAIIIRKCEVVQATIPVLPEEVEL